MTLFEVTCNFQRGLIGIATRQNEYDETPITISASPVLWSVPSTMVENISVTETANANNLFFRNNFLSGRKKTCGRLRPLLLFLCLLLLFSSS